MWVIHRYPTLELFKREKWDIMAGMLISLCRSMVYTVLPAIKKNADREAKDRGSTSTGPARRDEDNADDTDDTDDTDGPNALDKRSKPAAPRRGSRGGDSGSSIKRRGTASRPPKGGHKKGTQDSGSKVDDGTRVFGTDLSNVLPEKVSVNFGS